MAMATAPPPTTRRWTSDEVWRMVSVGLLGDDEPYELLEGELRYVSPQDPTHAEPIRRLTGILVRAYGEGFDVGVQLPMGGIRDSIPEPDLAVTPTRALGAPHPRADEAVLLVEVARTSRIDYLVKSRIYATAGCPEYWIADVRTSSVRVCRGPQADGTWDQTFDVRSGGRLALPGTGVEVSLAEFLPDG